MTGCSSGATLHQMQLSSKTKNKQNEKIQQFCLKSNDKEFKRQTEVHCKMSGEKFSQCRPC
jgi:hypothetical protein